MTKNQTLGQLRALLTAIGTVLTTWGITDGNQWAPVVGVIIAGISLTWGWLHHKDPATPSTLEWSLVRKFVNIAGSAAVTYGILNPDRVGAIATTVAALGPLLAASYSWIANSDDDTTPPAIPVWLFLIALTPFLHSCAGTEYITKGYIESPLGSFSTDGKTATYTPPAPTFSFPIQGTK
jgi:hypothetical protein